MPSTTRVQPYDVLMLIIKSKNSLTFPKHINVAFHSLPLFLFIYHPCSFRVFFSFYRKLFMLYEQLTFYNLFVNDINAVPEESEAIYNLAQFRYSDILEAG